MRVAEFYDADFRFDKEEADQEYGRLCEEEAYKAGYSRGTIRSALWLMKMGNYEGAMRSLERCAEVIWGKDYLRKLGMDK